MNKSWASHEQVMNKSRTSHEQVMNNAKLSDEQFKTTIAGDLQKDKESIV